jgi:TetR/AcrR family transcriptional regulator, transcriptional repressor for nem operon
MSFVEENTKDYIIQTVAPIFNKKGYIGTSLTDLTEATGLTKGAIYCNFKNKEDLAVKAFKYNLKKILFPLSSAIRQAETAIDKLHALVDFYKNYYLLTKNEGGCPVINIGIDANHNNQALYLLAKEMARKLELELESIIKIGIQNNEIKKQVEPKLYAKNIYCMIEGAIFMAHLQKDETYLINITEHLSILITEKMKK